MSRIGGKFLQSYKETWTTGTSLAVAHNFNTLDVLIIARDIDSGEIRTVPVGWGDYEVGAVATNANTVTVSAATAPTGSGIAITVIPV